MSAPQRLPVYLMHWNRPAEAIRLAPAMLASEGVAVELTVVDNGSRPDVVERLRAELPDEARLVEMAQNRGYCGVANTAIADFLGRSERPEEVAVLSAHDVVIEPDTLAALLRAASSATGYGVLGPAKWSAGFERVRSVGGRFHPLLGAPLDWNSPVAQLERGLTDVEFASGALLCLRRACLQDIGGFDEDLFAYWEDVDLCLRARARGWGVGVVLEARAAETGYSATHFTLAYLIARNHVLVVRKHVGRLASLAAAAVISARTAGALIGSLDPRCPADRRRSSRDFARGRWAGVRDGVAGSGGPPPGHPGRAP